MDFKIISNKFIYNIDQKLIITLMITLINKKIVS